MPEARRRILAGDIGGTSTRLALFEAGGSALAHSAIEQFTNREHPGLGAIVARFRASHGDPVDDATRRWPDDRPQVDAGTLTIDRATTEEEGACRNITFDPLILPAGMASSDDPLLAARSAVYAVSLTRRDGEPAAPSAASKDPAIRGAGK